MWWGYEIKDEQKNRKKSWKFVYILQSSAKLPSIWRIFKNCFWRENWFYFFFFFPSSTFLLGLLCLSLLGLAVFLLNFGLYFPFDFCFLPFSSLFRDLESAFLSTFFATSAASFSSSSSSEDFDGLLDVSSSSSLSDSGNWKKIIFYHLGKTIHKTS